MSRTREAVIAAFILGCSVGFCAYKALQTFLGHVHIIVDQDLKVPNSR